MDANKKKTTFVCRFTLKQPPARLPKAAFFPLELFPKQALEKREKATRGIRLGGWCLGPATSGVEFLRGLL